MALTKATNRMIEGAALNVKDFGAVGDGVTDDTDAIQATLQHAYNNAPQVSWRTAVLPIHFPIGRYLVTQSNVLFAGLVAGQFSISGAGFRKTTILYEPTVFTDTDYLINNADIFGFTWFKDISFEQTGMVDNWLFNHQRILSGNAQSLYFDRCSFRGMTNLMKVTGVKMTSEMTFNDCKIVGFSGTAFSFANEQSVNWRFMNCDIESFTGTLFKVIHGTSISVNGGSIISNTGGIVVEVPTTANPNTSGINNLPTIVFTGTRFELRDDSRLVLNSRSAFNLELIFNGCGMGGWNLSTQAATNYSIDFIDKTEITFNYCNNLGNHRIMARPVNASSYLYESYVAFNQCQTDVARTIAKASIPLWTSIANVGGYPTIYENTTNRSQTYSRALNTKDIRSAINVYGAGTYGNDKKYVGGLVVGTPVTIHTEDLSFTSVKKVEVHFDANTDYGTRQYTVNLYNIDKSTLLATATHTMNTKTLITWSPTDINWFAIDEGILVDIVPITAGATLYIPYYIKVHTT
jgi:hypothetical protein